MADYFAKPTYKNQDSFTFNISSSSNLPDNSLRISNPTYIFDDDDIQKHNNPYFGITSFGPSDKSYFKPKDLKILVICNSANRASFSNFVETLKKGLPSKPNNYGNFKQNYFADGFIGKYKFHNVVFDLEEIQSYECQTYLDKISNYLKDGVKPDLVILEVKQEFKKLNVVENPYYQVKSNLLSLAIPVQFVDNLTISDNRTKEAFYNIISLQMYAKLGGIPWALPTRRSYDKEIVIGVGSHLERKNKFRNNENTKVVGITTFFSGEGRYLLGNKCKEVDYDNYFDELLSNLRASIKDISKEQGWQDNSTVLVIFHIFKPIKMVEVKVIEKLISEFPQYKIKYAFVTISDKHPFLLFSSNQQSKNPQKSLNLVLDKFSCLLQSRGSDDLKSPTHGFPKPLLIKIIPSDNEEINFRDLSHIAQQIYSFSNLSFSSFYTSKMPVTILYSDKIAKWLSRLKKIVGWKPEVVNTELKMKKWFL